MSKMNPYPVFQKRGANYDTIHDESTITAKSNARYRYSVYKTTIARSNAPHTPAWFIYPWKQLAMGNKK